MGHPDANHLDEKHHKENPNRIRHDPSSNALHARSFFHQFIRPTLTPTTNLEEPPRKCPPHHPCKLWRAKLPFAATPSPSELSLEPPERCCPRLALLRRKELRYPGRYGRGAQSGPGADKTAAGTAEHSSAYEVRRHLIRFVPINCATDYPRSPTDAGS